MTKEYGVYTELIGLGLLMKVIVETFYEDNPHAERNDALVAMEIAESMNSISNPKDIKVRINEACRSSDFPILYPEIEPHCFSILGEDVNYEKMGLEKS
jgi:hypothetical protein